MAARNVARTGKSRIEFRIGIHLGDVMIDENDIFGDGVNIAARLEKLAEHRRHLRLRRRAPANPRQNQRRLRRLGPKTLKNIAEPMAGMADSDRQRGAPAPVPEPAKAFCPAKSPGCAADIPSIGVLPFQNMSGDPEQEYFAMAWWKRSSPRCHGSSRCS